MTKMKNKILLVTIFLGFSLLLHAQRTISISGGVKLIKADQRTSSLWFVDDSPSRDNLSINVKQEGNIAYQINLRFQDNNQDKKFHFFLEGQGYYGSINGLALNSGYFYKGNAQSKVRIQPEISGILGYSSKSLGVIENNDVYIQVNETKFQDYTNVNASLRNVYFGIKPGISFVFKTGATTEIGFGVNYQLSAKFGWEIAFSGTDGNGNPASDSKKLTDNNVGFYVDGVKTDKIPYRPDGLEFKVFYSF
jgi:hypothetical protein